MKNKKLNLFLVLVLCICLTGCTTTYPKNFLLPAKDSLQTRQLQMRQYESTNEKEIITACAGVLQDMGFTLDDSEVKLGLVVGSKDRDATNAGQVAMATVATALSAAASIYSGTYNRSNAFDYIDKTQKIKASVVSKLNAEGNRTIVRVTFQRIVWNNVGNISRIETLKDEKLYEGFFEKVSKAIFLEEQKI